VTTGAGAAAGAKVALSASKNPLSIQEVTMPGREPVSKYGVGRTLTPLLQDALMWKNFHALGLLQEIDAHRGAEGAREWRKFCWLVAHAQTRRDWLRSCLQA
jgi:hypothetical protein